MKVVSDYIKRARRQLPMIGKLECSGTSRNCTHLSWTVIAELFNNGMCYESSVLRSPFVDVGEFPMSHNPFKGFYCTVVSDAFNGI